MWKYSSWPVPHLDLGFRNSLWATVKSLIWRVLILVEVKRWWVWLGALAVEGTEANLAAILWGLNSLDAGNARKRFQYFKCEKLDE